MTGDIRITISDVERLIASHLGFKRWVERQGGDRHEDFEFWTLANYADILDDDTLQEAAESGIRDYLERNREELQTKINTTANAFFLEAGMGPHEGSS